MTPQGRETHAPWYRFHYHAHYYHILLGLDFMTALAYSSDKRSGYAISLLKKKRRSEGRWNLVKVNLDSGEPYGQVGQEASK